MIRYLEAPWTVDSTFLDADRSLLFHAIRNAKGTVIASTFAGPREQEANLIAAAPALLAALEAAEYRLSAMAGNGVPEVLEQIRAAIAKARGEA